MSLKTKLTVLFVAFTLVTLVLFGGIVFSRARSILETVRIAQLNTLADLKKDKIETFFNERREDLTATQNMHSIKRDLSALGVYANNPSNPAYRAATADLDDRLAPLQKTHGYLDIMLTDRKGKVVYVSNAQHAAVDLNRALREWQAFRNGKEGIYFTDIFLNREIGNVFETIGVAPIKDQRGAFIGEAVIEINMSPIYQLIQDTTGLGETGEALIARREGNSVLFLSPLRGSPDAALKKRVDFNDRLALAAQKAGAGENGSGLAYDYRGVEVLAAWRFIPSLRWGLVTKIDAVEAFAPVRQLRLIIITVETIMVLIGALVAAAISKAVARPLLSLQQGAEAVAAGDLNQRVSTGGHDEIGRLARAFDVMTEALARDIAKREQVEQALRENVETSQAIINATAESVLLIDNTWIVRDANETAARRLRRKREELIGSCIFDSLPPDIARTRKEHLEEIIRTKQPRSYVDILNDRYFEHSIYPVFDEGGAVARFAVYSRDITGRKKAEEKIRSLNENLKHHVFQLQDANRELEAFSYSVSHDLRTPLRSIDGFSLALLEDYGDKVDASGRDYLQRVRNATLRMSQLIDDLLNLSRVGRLEMKRHRVDLSTIATQLAERLKKNHPERAADFVITPGLTVVGDERLMTLVLENLFSNAWKFSEKKATTVIEFGVTQVQGAPAFFVRDNGAGFDMTFANKLFSPFQRLHRESEFPGTGIGLATVKRIISRHGGRVWIEGELDKGATVYFTVR